MERSKVKTMLKLASLIKPLTFQMCIAIIMGVIGYLCATFITIFAGLAICSLLGYNTYAVSTIIIVIITIAIMRGIFHYIEQYHNHYIAFKLLAVIRDKVFTNLRKLAPAKLDSKDSGNLISILTSDIELLEVFYAHTISPIVIAIITTSLMFVFLLQYHIILACTLLLSHFCIGVIIPIYASKKSTHSGKQYRKQVGILNTYFLDSLRGNQEILQYNEIGNRKKHIKQLSKDMELSNKHIKNDINIFSCITNGVILLSGVTMLFTGILLYQQGSIEIQAIIISTISIFASFGATVSLSNLGVGLTQTFASANRVIDILEEQPLIDEVVDGIDIDFKEATLHNVSFGYNQDKIIDDFSYKIENNKIIGIYGKSGCGKSTLLKLLMRFYDIDSGELSLNDNNIKNINTSSLRKNQSFVIQDTHIFHDSIKNNIKIANINASDNEVIEACQKASLHDFIMSLEDGYDTKITELGENLSGGQRQRIGIARAFLHPAKMILLDEPTSNLDSINESIILKSLKEVKDKTIMLVSHRDSTMNICDEVIRFDSNRQS